MSDTPSKSRFGFTGIAATLLVLTVLAAAAGKEFGFLDPALARTAVSFAFGGLLIVAGNSLPKLVLPATSRRRDPGRAAATERRAGWCFVLTGVGVIIAGLLAPQGQGLLYASLVGLAGFALVALNAAALILSPAIEPAQGEDDELPKATKSQRRTLFLILHALAWVYLIFLVDSLWGDAASKWTAVAFIFANGAAVTWVWPSIRKSRS
tara:strand:- start:6163 stop:6789 length:627 start_codon:yes stop_codon:yes gene_type:complete